MQILPSPLPPHSLPPQDADTLLDAMHVSASLTLASLSRSLPPQDADALLDAMGALNINSPLGAYELRGLPKPTGTHTR